MRRVRNLMHTSEIKKSLNLSLLMLSLIKVVIFVYVKTLMMLILFSKQVLRVNVSSTQVCCIYNLRKFLFVYI